jgi:hypothetical protein
VVEVTELSRSRRGAMSVSEQALPLRHRSKTLDV